MDKHKGVTISSKKNRLETRDLQLKQELRAALKSSIYRIISTYGDHLDSLPLPIEHQKKINKLPSGGVAHKSVFPSSRPGAAIHNKHPPLPSEKGDFQHVLRKVEAAEEDLLDQPKEHGDLLSQLEEAVVESLGAGKEMIAKAVADSWRPQVYSKLTRLICFCSIMSFQVEDLKEIHGKVLSSQDSATKEATAVRRALAGVYQVLCLIL